MANKQSFTTIDGRSRVAVSQLDFRRDAEAFTDVSSDETGILAEGLVIGFACRYYFYDRSQRDGSSVRIAVRGTYEGNRRVVAVPHSKYNPTCNLVDVEVPIFELEVASLAIKSNHTYRRLGEAALPYVLPDRYPSIYGTEDSQVGKLLGVHSSSASQCHMGHVEPDSIYYAPPDSKK